MRPNRRLAFVLLSVALLAYTGARAQRPAAVAVDPDDIGGVVTGPRGPEAGVWVIAETSDLPTRFVRIVVTDDEGRFLVPDLPTATSIRPARDASGGSSRARLGWR